MGSIAQYVVIRKVAIGVDTHKHIHVAVALDELGGRLGELTVATDRGVPISSSAGRYRTGRSSPSGSRARHRMAQASPATCVDRATASSKSTGQTGTSVG